MSDRMMLSKKIDSECRKRVHSLAARCNQTSGGVPVDLEKLRTLTETIVMRKINVKFSDYGLGDDCKGMLFPRQDGFLISINVRFCLYEQRLTFAHEIGHMLVSYDLSEAIPKMLEKFNRLPHNVQEDICDTVGLYLLCPVTEIIKLLKNFNELPYQLDLFKTQSPEIARLEMVADIFEVPAKHLGHYIKRHFRTLNPPFDLRELNDNLKIWRGYKKELKRIGEELSDLY